MSAALQLMRLQHLVRASAAALSHAAKARASPCLLAPARGLATVAFKLPDIGEGIAEVEVLRWFVKEGDRVAQFDKLLEVQSDKATVEITSRYDGVITKLHYKVGEMAKTASNLVDIEVPDHDGGLAAAAAAEAAAAAAASAEGGGGSASRPSGASTSPMHLRGLATPAVRRLAKEHGISVASVEGLGKGGRVTKGDMLRAVAEGVSGSGGAAVTAAAATAAAAAPHSSSSIQMPPTPPPIPATPSLADTRTPLSGYARAMSKSMSLAWRTPHFGFADEVCVDNLMRSREALRSAEAAAAAAAGVEGSSSGMSFLPILIKAASLALSAHPGINARLEEGGEGGGDVLVRYGSHNIGVAMDTPKGLVVPVIKGVQGLSIGDIAAQLSYLQALARMGKLGEAHLKGSTFTLSNIGSLGGTYMSPVIPSGTAAIGALGRIALRPRYASTLPRGAAPSGAAPDALVPAHIMAVSWSGDHRIVDGATMARFAGSWKGFLERPDTMLLSLR